MFLIDQKLIKTSILNVAYNAHKGHIGSSLSASDLVLVSTNLVVENQDFEMVLSKGHAALSLYCVLKELGKITEEELNSYCGDQTLFGTHPDPNMPLVNFIGGSLGQGISFAVGRALASKIDGSNKTIIVIVSDSELNSGVFWETIAIAASNKLNNLYILLDNNKQQALGLTEDIIKYPDIEMTLQSLGFDVSKIDGHNLLSIEEEIYKKSEKPRFIVADTKFGSGISFMEGQIAWHYLPLNKKQYELALEEINL